MVTRDCATFAESSPDDQSAKMLFRKAHGSSSDYANGTQKRNSQARYLKTEKKIQKCDLLEIYSASEREKLRVQEKIFQDIVTEGNNSDGGGGGNGSNSDDEFKAKGNIEFKDQKTLEYQEIVEQGGKLTKLAAASSYQDIYSQISDSDDDNSDSDDSDGDTSAHQHQHQHQHHHHDKISATRAAGAVDTITAATTHDHHHRTHQRQQQQLEEVNIDDI